MCRRLHRTAAAHGLEFEEWRPTTEDLDPDAPSATAECDELSALFAFFTHRLGVDDVGLFWPTGNHVVAVWTVEGSEGPVRIVVVHDHAPEARAGEGSGGD